MGLTRRGAARAASSKPKCVAGSSSKSVLNSLLEYLKMIVSQMTVMIFWKNLNQVHPKARRKDARYQVLSSLCHFYPGVGILTFRTGSQEAINRKLVRLNVVLYSLPSKLTFSTFSLTHHKWPTAERRSLPHQVRDSAPFQYHSLTPIQKLAHQTLY